MPLHIESSQERSITVFRLSGSVLAADGANELADRLQHQLQDSGSQVLLDVKGVTCIDRAGVKILRTLSAEAVKLGGVFKLSGARYPFLAALALWGGAAQLQRFDNVESALASFPDVVDERGIKRFDILEFVREQERENQQQLESGLETAAEYDI